MRHTVRQNSPVVVVGAGPAGLTAAITLARAGIETLVIEKRRGAVAQAARNRGEHRDDGAAALLGPRGARAGRRDGRRVASARDADAGGGSLGHAGRGRLPDPRAERRGEPDRAGLHPAGRARAGHGGAPRLAARGADRARRRGDRRRQPRRRRHRRRPQRERHPHAARPLPRRRRRHPQHGPRRARHRHPRARAASAPASASSSALRCGTSSASTATSSTSSATTA